MHTHARYDHKQFGVPISLHFDGVVTVGSGKKWARLIEAFSWTSIIAPRRESWITNFLIVLVVKMLLATGDVGHTMSVVWRELCWSLYWLYQARHADRCSKGVLYTPADGDKYLRRLTPLAGGYFGVVWLINMDFEWLKEYIKLFWAGIGWCALCLANTGDVPWAGCSFDAAWIATTWSDAAHRIAFPRRHVLLRHVPGVTIFAWIPDWLHTKHLGSDSTFLGSVLVALLLEFGWPGTLEIKLQRLWNDLSRGYRELGIHQDRITCLTWGMLQSSTSKLPTLELRGGQIQKLVPVIRLVFREYMDHGLATHRDMLTALDHCIAIDQILSSNSNKYALSPTDADELVRHYFAYCQRVHVLIEHYHPHTKLSNFTIKNITYCISL